MGRSSRLKLQGENIHIVFFSITLGAGNVTATLLDANWKVRILQEYERLVIDDLQGISVGDSPSDATIIVDTESDEEPLTSNLIASFINTSGATASLSVQFHKEGLSLPVGVLPVFIQNSGQNSVTQVTGNGRIVEGTTQGTQPNWEAHTTPRGNF